MSRIVISTVGSTGDLLPFIALGQGLKTRGHSVLFAVSATMHPTIQKAGLDVIECGPALGEQDARLRPEVFEGNKPFRQGQIMMLEWLIPPLAAAYAQLLHACKGADLLIATTIQFAAPMVHEKLGLHWISVSLSASQFPTDYESPILWPSSSMVFMNRLGWWTAKTVLRKSFLPALNRVRVRLGFRPLKGAPVIDDLSSELILLASSPHFSPPRPDWDARVKMTGFWFYDGQEQIEWQPGEELRKFIDHGEKPVVLSLGSMVEKDPERTVQLHAEAVTRLKRRLIIQQGWARLDTAKLGALLNSGQVIGAGFLPHDWLFSHAAAVIHHGGAGTTARALRHGCPMLLEPHGFDQPYNARRIGELHAGVVIPAHRVTQRELERKLPVVFSAETRSNVERLGRKIREENGVGKACELIEEIIRK